MKRTVFLLATAALAGPPPKPKPTPVIQATPAVRSIQMDERSLPTINTKLRYDTWIVFPSDETIYIKGGGDMENWQMVNAREKGPTNIFTIKPSVKGSASNLHILTSRGSYSFWVREISESCPSCAPDVKIFVEPSQQQQEATTIAANAVAAEDQKTIADLKTKVAGLEVDVLQAERKERTAKLDAENEAVKRIAAFRREWPATLRCDYDFRHNKEPFNIGAICTDGQFTYIESGSRGVESVYAVKADGLALVQFTYERGRSNHEGVYVLSGIITKGYLQTGKHKRLKFAIKG